MDRIDEALTALADQTWLKLPLPLIAEYMTTGSAELLPKLGAFNTRYADSLSGLTAAMAAPSAWSERDRRVLRVLMALRVFSVVGAAVSYWVTKEQGDELSPVVAEMEAAGWSRATIASVLIGNNVALAAGERITSAGNYLLQLPREELAQGIEQRRAAAPAYVGFVDLRGFVAFLAARAPETLEAVVGSILNSCRDGLGNNSEILRTLVQTNQAAFEAPVLRCLDKIEDPYQRFLAAEAIHAADPARYNERALAVARAAFAVDRNDWNQGRIAPWLARTQGAACVPDLVGFFERPANQKSHSVAGVLNAAGDLGREGIPVMLAALELGIREEVLNHLIALDPPELESTILAGIDAALAGPDATAVERMLGMAARWKPAIMAERYWKFLEHKSKPIRETCVRGLAPLGEAAVERAAGLLKHKKADVRLAAASLLGSVGGERALTALEKHVAVEKNDDVRDEALKTLAAAWAAAGRQIARSDVEGFIERAGAALEEPVADWLKDLPRPLPRWRGGDEIDQRTAKYLVYRQSRCKEIRSDVELAWLLPLLEPGSGARFAAAILEGFLASPMAAEDRWALTVAGLLGDDAVVPRLVSSIRGWVEANRGKLAEYAVEALALLGSDAALMAVDSLSLRYRNKMKNVGAAATAAFARAAEVRGLGTDELGDRVVPWLGFEPGLPRIVTCGTTRVRMGIGLDFKLSYQDADKGKRIAAFPKSAGKEMVDEVKALAAMLREAAKAQIGRMESMLVRQRRWPAPRWRELFMAHPVLRPFGARLVWGAYEAGGRLEACFRALEDGSLTTASDDAFELGGDDRMVGMVHPLELAAEDAQAWRAHLQEYEIEAPFPQLERDVVKVEESSRKERVLGEVANTKLNAMTFKSRAERLGWNRGSVCDGGGITSYVKRFEGAGVDVFVETNDFYVGIGVDESMTLGTAMFVRGGTVKVGSYTYDEPSKPDDARVLPFGEVPPIVYSETVGDLRRIAGKTATPEDSKDA